MAGFDRRNDEWLAEEAEVDRLIWLNDCRSRNGVDYNTQCFGTRETDAMQTVQKVTLVVCYNIATHTFVRAFI